MKTTHLKLVAFFVLVSSVLAGCSKSKSDPKPDYLGIYKVTVTESNTTNRDPKSTTTNTRSGNVVVSAGPSGSLEPNVVTFTDDLRILGWDNRFEVEVIGNAFKLPYKPNRTGAGKFTLNGFEISTTDEFGDVITTRDIKGTKL